MSDKIKYGESYESIAEHIAPYIPHSTQTFAISLYPVWWDKTITLYNRYENPTTQVITWYKHIIPNCFVKFSTTQISGGQIIYNSSSVIVRIPQNDIYKEYSAWINIPNVDMYNYFTLHTNDIIIVGAVDDVIDEYTAGKRSTDLTDKYNQLNKCVIIQNWQDNTGNGRTCPHYFISGGG